MNNKVCFKCGIEKPIIDYYKHRQMADGHLNKCKDCTKSDVHKHRGENLDKVQAYDRNRPNKEERAKKQGEYHKYGKGLEAKKISEKNYRNNYPQRYKAHTAVSNAVRDGRLIRPSVCSCCGITCKPHGHHDDYFKLLDVRWLCNKCHKDFHLFIRELYRNLEHTGIEYPFYGE